MTVQDQFLAEQECNEITTGLHHYDHQLTAVYELKELEKKGAVKFSPEEDQFLQLALATYQKFYDKCKATGGFDCQLYEEELKKFVQELSSELNWQHPVFSKKPERKRK